MGCVLFILFLQVFSLCGAEFMLYPLLDGGLAAGNRTEYFGVESSLLNPAIGGGGRGLQLTYSAGWRETGLRSILLSGQGGERGPVLHLLYQGHRDMKHSYLSVRRAFVLDDRLAAGLSLAYERLDLLGLSRYSQTALDLGLRYRLTEGLGAGLLYRDIVSIRKDGVRRLREAEITGGLSWIPEPGSRLMFAFSKQGSYPLSGAASYAREIFGGGAALQISYDDGTSSLTVGLMLRLPGQTIYGEVFRWHPLLFEQHAFSVGWVADGDD